MRLSRPPSVHAQLRPPPSALDDTAAASRGQGCTLQPPENWPPAHQALENAVWLGKVECYRWHDSSAPRTPNPVGRASERPGPHREESRFLA